MKKFIDILVNEAKRSPALMILVCLYVILNIVAAGFNFMSFISLIIGVVLIYLEVKNYKRRY